MLGRYIKVLSVILITLVSLTLNGCFYIPNPNPEFKTTGSTSGEFNYNGRILKIEENYKGNSMSIVLQESDGDEELERIINGKGGTLIRTTIQSCSDTKLVLKVDYSNLPDFKYTKIVFKKS